MKIICVLLICAASAFSLSPPVLYPASGGTCTNFCQIGFFEIAQGPITCYTYTLNGSTPATPTAAVAGTCDNGGTEYSTFSTNAQWASINIPTTCTQASPCTLQIKAIFTQNGQTNSTVTNGTYTVSYQAATNPVSVPTATNITSASGNFVYNEPVLLNNASDGRIYLAYNACNCGLSPDNTGYTGWVELRYLNLGTWTKISNSECPGASDPVTGCFFDIAAMNRGHYITAFGVDSSGVMIAAIAQWNGATPVQVLIKTCNSASVNCTVGSNWATSYSLTTGSQPAANNFINPTSNIIAIPPNASGVSSCNGGSMTNGCIIMPVLGKNGGITGLVYNTNHGASGSWTGPVSFGTTVYPFAAEEKALYWFTGTNNLIMFQRPSTNDVAGGGPTTIGVMTSTNLGSSWNSYTPVSQTDTGGATNLPIGPCGNAPQVSWTDIYTRPTIAIDPNNSNLATLLYGERLTCSSGGSGNFWKIATFNLSNAFSGAGQNIPAPQILNLYPAGLTQLHTVYSYLIPSNSTQLLMAYEQGNTATSEDIMTTTMSYPAGILFNGGTAFLGGIAVQ